MSKEKFSKLAELFERIGQGQSANDMRRNCGIPIRVAQSEDPRKPPLFPADIRSKRNIFEGPRLTKMHDKFNAVPQGLQDWTSVEQRGKTVQQMTPMKAPSYVVDPEHGGQPGFPLPSGGRVIGLNLPKTEGGEYEGPESGIPEIITPGGGYEGGWQSPEDQSAFIEGYMNKLEDFENQTTQASQTFNKRNRDWIEDESGRPSVARLLSQNFWSIFDSAIAGGSLGLESIDSGEGRNLLASIEHRLNAIADIKGGVDVRRAAQGDEMKEAVLEQQTDAMASLSDQLWDSNPQAYIRNLSLVYSGDPDLMRINPLGVSYPQDLSGMLEAYVGTGTASANIPETMDEWVAKNTKSERAIQGVDPMDMLRQKWPLIDVGPEAMHRAALMRKQIRDTSHFYGFTSPKTNFEVPMPQAQLHNIDDYGDEVNRLMSLKEGLMRMIELKHGAGLEANSWEQVASKPGLVQEMDSAITDALTLGGRLYGSDNFVTKDDRMSAAYDIGQATKMEIFMKVLYIAQAWKAFLSQRMPQLVEQQGIDPNEIGMGLFSHQIAAGFLRLSIMSDEMGNHRFSDIIDSAMMV